MRRMRGRVIIAQESRFQLLDDDGVAHLFVLDAAAGLEPSQLAPLQKGHTRVVVSYAKADDMLAHVARSIEIGDAP